MEILLIPFMTIMSRACGGGYPKIPFGLDQFIMALPYLLFYPLVGHWVWLGYAGAVLGLRMAHGRGFHYSIPFKPGSKPEKIEILIPSSLRVKHQKMLIMAYTGLAVTLVIGLELIIYGYILAGATIMASGVFKLFAYMTSGTEHSELLRGLFLGIGVYLALLIS